MPPRAADSTTRSVLIGIAVAGTLLLLWMLRDLVVLIALSMLFAYLLDPVVSLLERIRLPRGRAAFSRGGASALVVLGLLAVLSWLLVLAVPRLFREIGRFVEAAPGTFEALLAGAREWAVARGLGGTVDPMIADMRAHSPELMRQAGAQILAVAGRLFGGLDDLIQALLVPLLAFYLLAEREAVRASAWRFVPGEFHGRLDAASRAVDRALKSYVRGQVIVCVVMGAVNGAVLALLGLPLSLLLAVVIGLAEIVPYLGFAIAATVVGLVGFTASTWHGVAGLITYTVLNNLIGNLVTPRVMGRHLEMHPFLITVSVLAGAQLLGGAGVLVALPAMAVVQALVSELAPDPADRPPRAG